MFIERIFRKKLGRDLGRVSGICKFIFILFSLFGGRLDFFVFFLVDVRSVGIRKKCRGSWDFSVGV